MIGLAAYVALVVAIPALMLGHAGEDWPLTGLRRTVRAARPRARRHAPAGAPHSPTRDSRDAGTPERAPQRRTRPVPSWAHTYDHEEAA